MDQILYEKNKTFWRCLKLSGLQNTMNITLSCAFPVLSDPTHHPKWIIIFKFTFNPICYSISYGFKIAMALWKFVHLLNNATEQTFYVHPHQWHGGHSFFDKIMVPSICRVCFFLFHFTLLDPDWEIGLTLNKALIQIYSFRALGNYVPNWRLKTNHLLNIQVPSRISWGLWQGLPLSYWNYLHF